jgi:hypothetical protein
MPLDVVVDGAGDLFIADSGEHVVRKVNANNTISTIAGQEYIFGYTGDGEDSTRATLEFPWAVAIGANGNLLIADAWANVIRETVPQQGVMRLNNVTTNDAGNYSVTITNLAGDVTSEQAILTVLVSPFITVQPTNQTVALGDGVSFSVAVGGTLPLSYQWWFNGTNPVSGANSAVLSIPTVLTNNAGTYVVTVSNIVGGVRSSNSLLTVLVPPTITRQPANASVNQGTTVTFRTTASGTLPLCYQWWFKGTNQIWGATNQNLTLINVQATNGGYYSETVSNMAGSVSSANALLTVRVPPTITTQPANIAVIQ